MTGLNFSSNGKMPQVMVSSIADQLSSISHACNYPIYSDSICSMCVNLLTLYIVLYVCDYMHVYYTNVLIYSHAMPKQSLLSEGNYAGG